MIRARKIFCVEKFKPLLVVGTLNVLTCYLIRLTDSVVAGNLIGADALAGVNLIAPLASGLSFLSMLIGSGTATNYQIALGRMEPKRACRFFSQGVWTALIFGGAMSLAAYAFGGAYLDFMGADLTVLRHAGAYLRWFGAVPVVECVETVLVMTVIADGGARLCMVAYGVNFAVKVAVCVVGVLCGMGTAACAAGTVMSELLAVAVLACHFFQKCNTLGFVRHFSVLDTWRIAVASFGDAASFLCDSLLFLLVNRFAIMRFGSDVLPVIAVATVVWGFLAVFNGVGNAIQPIVPVYYGENNYRPIRQLMDVAQRVSFAEGAALTALMLAFPGLAARIVGISDPALLEAASVATRAMSIGFVAVSISGLFNSYYMFIERPLLAGTVTFLCYFAFPAASLMSGASLGETGMWIGFGLGPLIGCAAVSCWIIAFCGRRAFPLLLPFDREEMQCVFNLQLNEAEISEASQVVGSLPGVPMRAALMVEEVLMVVRDRAAGRPLLGEVTVDLNDGVVLIIRDDGEIFDITDADARISSLRSFLVASVMERQRKRHNFITSGFNRNVFRF